MNKSRGPRKASSPGRQHTGRQTNRYISVKGGRRRGEFRQTKESGLSAPKENVLFSLFSLIHYSVLFMRTAFQGPVAKVTAN